jgi:tRNA(Ile)-lysidine synthase
VSREAFVDARALRSGISVRGFRPGDRFRPLGGEGSRKLKEFFIDLRLPASERAGVPLVFAGDYLLWVGGYALGERGRIRSDTEDVVRLAIEGVAAEDEDPYHGR